MVRSSALSDRSRLQTATNRSHARAHSRPGRLEPLAPLREPSLYPLFERLNRPSALTLVSKQKQSKRSPSSPCCLSRLRPLPFRLINESPRSWHETSVHAVKISIPVSSTTHTQASISAHLSIRDPLLSDSRPTCQLALSSTPPNELLKNPLASIFLSCMTPSPARPFTMCSHLKCHLHLQCDPFNFKRPVF